MHLQESASDLEWQLDALQQQMDEHRTKACPDRGAKKMH
mgnify:CR=1 FL=1